MDIFFDNEFRNLIPALQPDERERLETSLKGPEGNRVPITIWKEKQLLLDGHNRYDICTVNNIPLKPAEELSFPDREAAMIWIIDNQLGRRNIVEYTRILLGEMRVEKVAIRNAAIQKATIPLKGQKGFQSTNDTTTLVGTLDNSKKSSINVQKETATAVAKVSKTSRAKVYKARKIKERATKEQKDKLARGDATINQVYKAITQEEAKERVQKTEWPTGKYRVIYADPPWKYGNSMPEYASEQDNHYPTHTVKELCDKSLFPVVDLAMDNAVLQILRVERMFD
jgi:hypothetical protein